MGNNIGLVIDIEHGNMNDIRLRLGRGADINNLISGYTPLGHAVKHGKIEAVKYLINKGADVCKAGKFGKSPLAEAALNKNLTLVKLLLDNGAQSTIQSAFFDAIQPGNLNVVQYLHEKGAFINYSYKNGHTPLTKSIEIGDNDIVKYLLANNANTKIVIVQEEINKFLLKYVVDQNMEMVRILVEMGVKTDTFGKCRFSPLTKAVQMEDLKMVQYLIEQGADIDLIDKNKKCALAIAASNCSFRIVKYLIDQGANIYLAKQEIEDYASWNEDIAICLKASKMKNSVLVSGSGQEAASK